ncbi:hypothetical protein ACFLT1_00690 [Bacteroidota bacterium]
MQETTDSRMKLKCKVIEVISRGDERMVSAICDPASLIIEIPDNGTMELGDEVMVSGTFHIDQITYDSESINEIL